MKRVGTLWWWLALALVVPGVGMAKGPGAGDEDPFPLLCTDFSGNWRSDAGDRYSIQQRQCSYLRVLMSFGSESDTFTIVPDNRTRTERNGQVRHRWNSPSNATVLETHRTYVDGNSRVTEVVMFERANRDLLLETTYRTIECVDGAQPPRREYGQSVFRRLPD